MTISNGIKCITSEGQEDTDNGVKLPDIEFGKITINDNVQLSTANKDGKISCTGFSVSDKNTVTVYNSVIKANGKSS